MERGEVIEVLKRDAPGWELDSKEQVFLDGSDGVIVPIKKGIFEKIVFISNGEVLKP